MSGELRELAERLSKYGVRLVVLFGSRARGDYTDGSDVDVLVVADELPDDPREAYDVVRRLVSPRVHPVCLRTEAFVRRLEGESTFLMEVLEDGVIVYADRGFLEEVLHRYREVRRRWVRKGRTWERLVE